MSGRPKVRVYQYDENGKYMGLYESQAELRRKYFSGDNGKRPLFQSLTTPYRILPDGTYIAEYRIGREGLMKAIKLANCPFCKKNKRQRRFSVYNMLGKRIAEFSSIRVGSLLTGISEATLHSRLKNEFEHNSDNLIYKYD